MMCTSPKYVGSYASDGLLNTVYQVHEIKGDVYILEAISYFDLVCIIESGCEPSEKVVIEQVYELKLSDIENPKLFYSWIGIAGEFVRAERVRDRNDQLKKNHAEA